MNLRYGVFLAGISLSAAPMVTHARTLECQGTIISEGDTEQQLLDACGEPTSRQGANWQYDVPGSLPAVVTLGEGLVMFIRDAGEVDPSGSPLGDHP